MLCVSSASTQKKGMKQIKNNQPDIKAHESNLKKEYPRNIFPLTPYFPCFLY